MRGCRLFGMHTERRSRRSSVGLVTRLWSSSIPGRGKSFIPPPHALGPTQRPVRWVPAALSQGVKRPWYEAHHLPRLRMSGAVYRLLPTHSWRKQESSQTCSVVGRILGSLPWLVGFGRTYSSRHELCILALMRRLVRLRRAEISSLLSVQKAHISGRRTRG